MTKQTRRKFTAEFKARVALAAIKEQQTLAELAKKFEINPVLISRWKAEFIQNMAAAFKKENTETKDLIDPQELYSQIGQLKVENDFFKKSLRCTLKGGESRYQVRILSKQLNIKKKLFYFTAS